MGIHTWCLGVCLFLNLKQGDLDHSATTAGWLVSYQPTKCLLVICILLFSIKSLNRSKSSKNCIKNCLFWIFVCLFLLVVDKDLVWLSSLRLISSKSWNKWKSLLWNFRLKLKLNKLGPGSNIYRDKICVYDEHPLAGRDIQYRAPNSRSSCTTPFDNIKTKILVIKKVIAFRLLNMNEM